MIDPGTMRESDRQSHTIGAPLARALVLAALALAAALAVRHLAIEPAAIAHACDPAPWQGACALRSATMRLFVSQEIGWLAFAAGAAAAVLRARVLATVGLVAGAAGLVLYSYEPAAVGALLGALVLVRANAQPARTSIDTA